MPIDASKPAEGEAPRQGDLRANFAAIARMVGTMRESWSGLAGRLLAVKADGSGPDVLDGPLDGGGQPVGGFVPEWAEWPADGRLTETAHAGRNLQHGSAGGVSLSIERTGNPDTGVRASFGVSVFRAQGAGAVTILVNSPLSLAQAGGQNKVGEGQAVTIAVNGDSVWLLGGLTA